MAVRDELKRGLMDVGVAESGELFDGKFEAPEVVDKAALYCLLAGVYASSSVAVEAAFAEFSSLANAL